MSRKQARFLRAPIALSVALNVSVHSAGALAQRAPPSVSQLIVDPKDERHLALRSSFGLMLSHDAGATWDWRSKASMGYEGPTEPAIAIVEGGALLVGSSNGVTSGDAAGCKFERAAGIAGNVVDIVAIPATRGAALAVSASYSDSTSRLWKTQDNGRSFRAVGAPLAHFTALSLGLPRNAPPDPPSRALSDAPHRASSRVYLTGLLWAEAVQGALAVSNDAGKSFTITPLQNSDSGSQPFIAAVNPNHPDTLYLRFTGTPGRLQVSDDAGRSFRQVLSLPGPLQGFSITPNGERIFASSLEAGIYRADTANLKFEQLACEGLPCLTATDTGLLACGEPTRNGFIAGRSLDAGQSFTPLLAMPCIVPPRCNATSAVAKMSAQDWPRIAAQLGVGKQSAGCDGVANNRALRRDCFADGGSGGASAGKVQDKSAHAASSAGVGDSDVRAPASEPPHAHAAGCGCSFSRNETVPTDRRTSLLGLILAGVGVVGARVRRDRVRAMVGTRVSVGSTAAGDQSESAISRSPRDPTCQSC